MSRHIIVTPHRVLKGSVATPLRRDQFVQSHLHITSNIWICILVDSKRGTRVLDEQIGQTNFDLWKLILDGLVDVRGDEMTSPRGSSDGYFLLIPHGR